MLGYNKSSVIVSKEAFEKDENLLESANYSKLPQETLKINVTSLSDYIKFSEVLEDKNFIIVDNDNTYLVEGNVAVKV